RRLRGWADSLSRLADGRDGARAGSARRGAGGGRDGRDGPEGAEPGDGLGPPPGWVERVRRGAPGFLEELRREGRLGRTRGSEDGTAAEAEPGGEDAEILPWGRRTGTARRRTRPGAAGRRRTGSGAAAPPPPEER